MLRPAFWATIVSGVLDILFAMGLTMIAGNDIPTMLRGVGSGPFPAAVAMGAKGAMIGLVVHFTLMAIMVGVYFVAAARLPSLTQRPILWGVAYGLLTYLIMNWVVLPIRFGSPLPPQSTAILTQLFAHIVLVGIPIALIAARYLRLHHRQ